MVKPHPLRQILQAHNITIIIRLNIKNSRIRQNIHQILLSQNIKPRPAKLLIPATKNPLRNNPQPPDLTPQHHLQQQPAKPLTNTRKRHHRIKQKIIQKIHILKPLPLHKTPPFTMMAKEKTSHNQPASSPPYLYNQPYGDQIAERPRMFPDMYLQYNHPTIKSQQKPFDKNRQYHIPLHPPQRRFHTSPHNASTTASIPHLSPQHQSYTHPTTHPAQRRCPTTSQETQPLQPSSAALMAHPLPSDHHSLTPPKTRTDSLPAGRLHGRDPVRWSKPLVILGA